MLLVEKDAHGDIAESNAVTTVRAALLADSASQYLARALRNAATDRRLNLDLFEADYDQVDQNVLDLSSALYSHQPQFVIVFHSVEKLHKRFQAMATAGRSRFAEEHLESVRGTVQTLSAHSRSNVIYFNFPEVDDAVFGTFANKVPSSWLFQLRSINLGLMSLAQVQSNLFIADLAQLSAEHGHAALTDRRLSLTAQMALGLNALPLVAQQTMGIVAASLGSVKKCLVLDLDNTLWGGVVGDDGLEGIEIGDLGLGPAFSELQAWAKQLRERGVLLAVCSKNDEVIAKSAFERHPQMILRLDDIAVFVANWDNKADNIRRIREALNIGFDAMVFVDDNPMEREQVRRSLPQVCVPDLPEDTVEFLPSLRRLNLFETVGYTTEDSDRTASYQTEFKRRELQSVFADEKEFLASLNMRATVESLTPFNIPRVAQLSQRSNQFNLRTVRYSEEQLHAMAVSEEHLALAFSLEDKFGSYGLVSVVVLERQGRSFFIDNWFMSCRVLKRGMERFILNCVVEAAKRNGADGLLGHYLPTAKNGLVRDHYRGLGFVEQNEQWHLRVADFTPFAVAIIGG